MTCEENGFNDKRHEECEEEEEKEGEQRIVYRVVRFLIK